MGDDVGWFNIGAYHQGIMSGKTPNLDKLASEGMRFTDYYAEASCTAGRANFITGEIADPHRTDHRRPGRRRRRHAGASAAPSPRRSKRMGYATGQFGKNHLGDLNKYPADACTASMSSSATCTTSTPCRIPYWYSYPDGPGDP